MKVSFLLRLVRPYHRGLLILMGLLLAEMAVALVLPLLAGRLGAIFLSAAPQSDPIGYLLLGILGLLAVTGLLRAASALLYARSSETILADLRQRMFDHLLALPLPWHQRQDRGSLMALATLEIERLGHFVTGTLVSFVPLVLTAFGATVLMFTIDPVLALVIPVLVPAFYIGTRIVGRALRELGAQIQDAHAATMTSVEEMLDLAPALKACVAETPERADFARRIARLKSLSLREARIYAIIDPVMQFAVASAAVILLVLAGQNLRAGGMDTAETISFLLYVALLVRPVSQLAPIYGEVQTARGTLARLEAVLSEPTEAPAAGLPYPQISGAIRFVDVGFAYPDRSPALTGLSFDVAAGEIVALTGQNGAGKSTAISLLLAFAAPMRGQILLDGRDIADMPPDHLRQAIGLVPQTRYLRNATVRDNIKLGRPGLEDAQMIAAARTAQAHDFILTLPQGYDTLIGDRGLRLSGGQQQRLALARALIGNPPILVLDEATSMYDLEGEAAFIAECRDALAGRTVIVITHRPASLALADRVLRLEAGRIAQEIPTAITDPDTGPKA